VARNSVELPVGPLGVRLFIGYRAPGFTVQPSDDEATRKKKRTDFFNELGGAFMPGTPVMQAPLGLAAYVPAVLDTEPGSGLPDEVAAIVYASRVVYDRFRETSLSRRIYTRSHVAVFDMGRSIAQFPQPLSSPTVVQVNGSAHHFTFLFPDGHVDWQAGSVRVVFLTPAVPGAVFQADMLHRLGASATAAAEAGINQILMLCGDGFAALWFHSGLSVADAPERLNLVPNGATVRRNLEAVHIPVTGDFSPGVAVNDAMAITFRFERKLDLFIPPQ
jgi:hypothetical protein